MKTRPVARAPRANWEAAAARLRARDEDAVLEAFPVTRFDETEWKWKVG